jgi:hypothetical protein
LYDAIELAREKAGIDPDEEVALLDLSIKGLFDFGSFSPSPVGILSRLPWLRGWGATEPVSDVDEKVALVDEFFDDYEMTYLREIAERNGRALCLIPPDFLPEEARVAGGAREWPQVR